MQHIKAFPWWTHKILPLVYDESLSYYEFLCKVMAKLNEIIEHDTEQDEQIEANRVAIENEITRATNRENEIEGNLNDEIARATARENQIETALNNEITRATNRENEIEGNLNAEIARATTRENQIESALNDEFTRATARENQIETEGQAAITSVKSNIASTYDETIPYQRGTMVWKDGVLLTALVDIPANSPFDANKWTANTVGLNQANDISTFASIRNFIATNFAPFYNENTTYYPTQVVARETPASEAWEVDNITLYKCISQTTGTWDASKWEIYEAFAFDMWAHLNKLYSQYISVANGYSENTIYNTGDYVWRDTAETLRPWNFGTYELYRCNENNVTGVWDAEKWVSISNIMGEIQRVINSVNTNYEYLLGLIQNLTLNVNQNSADILEINGLIEAVFNSMGEFDDSKTYNSGNYVWYNNGSTIAIYKCVNYNVTGSWNNADWNEVKFFDDIVGKFSDIYSQIGQNDDTSFSRYQSAIQSIAPIYNSTNANYNIGDLVYYAEPNLTPILYTLYKCVNPTSGVWNVSDWVPTTIENEIKNSGGGSGSNYVQNGLEIQSKNIGRGVTSPSLINPAQYKTIECCFKWNNVDSVTNMGRAISLENSEGEIFAININQNFANNVEWKAGTWTDNGKSGIAMAANSYHTFSFVFFEEDNTEKVSVYYDGAKVTTQNGTLGEDNVTKICFKMSDYYTSRELDGNIKNFRVYSRALSDNEILLNYAVDINS